MKVCTYCNTTNDDDVKTCISCGGNSFKNKCENCGMIFDEGMYCPNCGVKAGTIAKRCPDCGTEYFSNACPNCGYIGEKSQSTDDTNEISDDAAAKPARRRNTWLWAFGWIFLFPVPLTILMLRNQKLNRSLKIGIIIAAWILYFYIGLFGRTSADNEAATPSTTIDSSESLASTDCGPMLAEAEANRLDGRRQAAFAG